MESEKKEEFSFPEVNNLPNSKAEVMKIYNELSPMAKNDNLFMSIFWASYGFNDESQAYLNEYRSEYKVVNEYKDIIKKSN